MRIRDWRTRLAGRPASIATVLHGSSCADCLGDFQSQLNSTHLLPRRRPIRSPDPDSVFVRRSRCCSYATSRDLRALSRTRRSLVHCDYKKPLTAGIGEFLITSKQARQTGKPLSGGRKEKSPRPRGLLGIEMYLVSRVSRCSSAHGLQTCIFNDLTSVFSCEHRLGGEFVI